MRPRGFTLFELIVALALSVALMAMIGFALRFYAQTLNERNTDVRRAQLARAVLRMITEDLKASIRPAEFDDAELTAMLQSAGASEVAESFGFEEEGFDDALLPEEEDYELASDLDLSVGTTMTQRPGLMGNQYQIQFDVSRLPRMEEYWSMMATGDGAELVDVPSDLKTVSYYVQSSGGSGAEDVLAELEGRVSNSGGLVRRELDRAVTAWAATSGNMQRLERSGALLAPEVASIEFAYWDGFQWVFEWNSDEYDALPRAVRVRLTVRDSGADEAESVAAAAGEEQAAGGETYEVIIRLPAARQAPSSETGEALDAGISGLLRLAPTVRRTVSTAAWGGGLA